MVTLAPDAPVVSLPPVPADVERLPRAETRPRRGRGATTTQPATDGAELSYVPSTGVRRVDPTAYQLFARVEGYDAPDVAPVPDARVAEIAADLTLLTRGLARFGQTFETVDDLAYLRRHVFENIWHDMLHAVPELSATYTRLVERAYEVPMPEPLEMEGSAALVAALRDGRALTFTPGDTAWRLASHACARCGRLLLPQDGGPAPARLCGAACARGRVLPSQHERVVRQLDLRREWIQGKHLRSLPQRDGRDGRDGYWAQNYGAVLWMDGVDLIGSLELMAACGQRTLAIRLRDGSTLLEHTDGWRWYGPGGEPTPALAQGASPTGPQTAAQTPTAEVPCVAP